MNTACTPGRASAADASMPSIRARANGLRTKQACSMPGRMMSSTNVPWPVSSRASSTRGDPGARVAGGDSLSHGDCSNASGPLSSRSASYGVPSLGLNVVVDSAVDLGQRLAAATPAPRDDLRARSTLPSPRACGRRGRGRSGLAVDPARPRSALPRAAVPAGRRGCGGAHRADVADLGSRSATSSSGHVELGVVGEHADHGARRRRSASTDRPGSGAASRRRPRRPSGSGRGSRTPPGRRTP